MWQGGQTRLVPVRLMLDGQREIEGLIQAGAQGLQYGLVEFDAGVGGQGILETVTQQFLRRGLEQDLPGAVIQHGPVA